MNFRWLFWVRRLHLFLSVFFSPLLLLFLVTGCWQTLTTDDQRQAAGGFLHTLMGKLSSIHTDDEFPRPNVVHPAHLPFQILVVSMCAALIISISLGLILAWQIKRKGLVVVALLLGIVVPALLLYFA